MTTMIWKEIKSLSSSCKKKKDGILPGPDVNPPIYFVKERVLAVLSSFSFFKRYLYLISSVPSFLNHFILSLILCQMLMSKYI